MKLNTLRQEQVLDAPLELVFPFFARPENLEKLTPASLGFRVLTPSPIPMHVGAIIDYVVSLHGIPMRWTTAISEYDPPCRFVDVQLKGPYTFWHHTHSFEAQGERTLVRDEVHYALPMGLLGAFVHSLLVRRQLNDIFGYRREFLANITDWHALPEEPAARHRSRGAVARKHAG